MKKILITGSIVAAAILGGFTVAAVAQANSHEQTEICRVFRELNHARTVIYLDEIDVQDCPVDFQRAYSTYVLEMRSAGLFSSSKRLALAKLEDAARAHGVTFTPKPR